LGQWDSGEDFAWRGRGGEIRLAMNQPGLAVRLSPRAEPSPSSLRSKTFKVLFASFSFKKKKTLPSLLSPLSRSRAACYLGTIAGD